VISRTEITDNLDSILATLGPVLGVGLTPRKRRLTIHSDVIRLFMSYLMTQAKLWTSKDFQKLVIVTRSAAL